tara:strand:- start:1733 stop:1909 length:177 start_codon:yes stop_codon:yes gene_type:complete
MKAGDLVEKHKGDWDVGKIGCVLEVTTNRTGTDLVKVFVDGKVKSWSKNLTRVINEKK